MQIESLPFGNTLSGKEAQMFKLTNSAGHTLRLSNYGATVLGVDVPDRDGKIENITLGFPDLGGYLDRHPYFGSTVGRFCNRIAGGRFTIDDTVYQLAVNNGPNHLHGGLQGFDRLVWSAKTIEDVDRVGIRFELLSPDGEEGYPGNMNVSLDVWWSEDSQLTFHFIATCDAPTIVNLTNHTYWNLSGAATLANGGLILEHELQLECDKVLVVDATQIPTGELQSVADTGFDFRQVRKIGERILDLDNPLGYDHCFVLGDGATELAVAAIVRDPESGRSMEISTTQPGIQLYTGNHLSGKPVDGSFAKHSGFCLETQHYPDSPNQPAFPSTRLEPGQVFQARTVHRFWAE